MQLSHVKRKLCSLRSRTGILHVIKNVRQWKLFIENANQKERRERQIQFAAIAENALPSNRVQQEMLNVLCQAANFQFRETNIRLCSDVIRHNRRLKGIWMRMARTRISSTCGHGIFSREPYTVHRICERNVVGTNASAITFGSNYTKQHTAHIFPPPSFNGIRCSYHDLIYSAPWSTNDEWCDDVLKFAWKDLWCALLVRVLLADWRELGPFRLSIARFLQPEFIRAVISIWAAVAILCFLHAWLIHRCASWTIPD